VVEVVVVHRALPPEVADAATIDGATRDDKGRFRARAGAAPAQQLGGPREATRRSDPCAAAADGVPSAAMSRILLCEDDDLIATMVALVLEQEGHTVEVVGDGEAALRRAEGQELLLLDINLPGRDGVEVAALLRQRGHRAPVLMLTSLDDTRHKVRAFDAGADDYLAKPFELPELIARVRALLRRAEAQGGRVAG
jgi:CheY-like chemotaxis protein